jgi:hypothetical protein
MPCDATSISKGVGVLRGDGPRACSNHASTSGYSYPIGSKTLLDRSHVQSRQAPIRLTPSMSSWVMTTPTPGSNKAVPTATKEIRYLFNARHCSLAGKPSHRASRTPAPSRSVVTNPCSFRRTELTPEQSVSLKVVSGLRTGFKYIRLPIIKSQCSSALFFPHPN